MKVVNSLKSAKLRHRDCRVVRRKGRVYVTNKTNPRFNTARFIGECFQQPTSADPVGKRKLDRLREEAASLGNFEA